MFCVLEEDLSQAGLGCCGSASVLVSSGLTEDFNSCYLCCSQKRCLYLERWH